MDEMVYNSLYNYYHVLENTGYIADCTSYKLLVLSFLRNFVMGDYRGYIKEADYKLIDTALENMYGTHCLIPYPDYLKNGNLHLARISKLASRVKNLENTSVVKLSDITAPSSDFYLEEEEVENN